jgi:uncharacterized protein
MARRERARLPVASALLPQAGMSTPGLANPQNTKGMTRHCRGVEAMVSASNSSERVVLSFFEALSSGDLEKTAGWLCEDLSWTAMITGVPGAGRHEGREHVMQHFIGPVRGMFKPGDPKVHVDSIVSAGDFVMAETHATGNRADGRVYDNRYAWAFEMRAGRIAHIREYMDSLYVARFFDMDLSGSNR